MRKARGTIQNVTFCKLESFPMIDNVRVDDNNEMVTPVLELV